MFSFPTLVLILQDSIHFSFKGRLSITSTLSYSMSSTVVFIFNESSGVLDLSYLYNPIKYTSNTVINVISIINKNIPINFIESCKIKTKVGKENIYYYIRKQDNSYMLDINRLYIKIASINIGDNIDSLVLSKYNDIDMIKTIYHDEVSSYDEVIFVNEVNKDIITSVSTNEIEVTSDGIIYYTYSCLKSNNTNSMKFKNIRKPFDNTNTIMSVEDVNLDYC